MSLTSRPVSPTRTPAPAGTATPWLVKVPAVTGLFWVVKVLTTGMGEAASDYLAALDLALHPHQQSVRTQRWAPQSGAHLLCPDGDLNTLDDCRSPA